MQPNEIDKNNLMRTSYYLPSEYKGARLSLTQRDLVRMLIKLGPITTQAIAEINSLSIANASNQLRALFHLGFINREELPDPTGGFLYQYSCDPKKWG